jgi:hypothetical protein
MIKQPSVKPGLFGIKNSNRGFTKKENCGKINLIVLFQHL